MEEFRYKEYTEEESRRYEQALQKILDGLRSGLPFREACDAVHHDDEALRAFVEDDALKIMIAEMHYNGGQSLEEVARKLGVAVDTLARANREMLQDVEAASVDVFRAHHPGSHSGSA